MIIDAIILILLIVAELLYFKIADRFNIIDKPNERSSHSRIVIRGGGIIYPVSVLIFAIVQLMCGNDIDELIPFIAGLMVIATVSMCDDIRSVDVAPRLVGHFIAIMLMFYCIGFMHIERWWLIPMALVMAVGVINVINFMDGVNGITSAYSMSVLIPLVLLNTDDFTKAGTVVDNSLIVSTILANIVFAFFNMRSKGKARCFAGDVGSISIAFILLFIIGKIVYCTGDITYLVLLVVYGIDGGLTIVHRMMLHENLSIAHRKHAYQIMANELGIGHVTISLFYMTLQLAISLVMIFLIPQTAIAHWIYLISCIIFLSLGYVIFMKKFYHLHEEYLEKISG